MRGDLRLGAAKGKRSLIDRLKVTKIVKVTKVMETTTKSGTKRGAIDFRINFGGGDARMFTHVRGGMGVRTERAPLIAESGSTV